MLLLEVAEGYVGVLYPLQQQARAWMWRGVTYRFGMGDQRASLGYGRTYVMLLF
jgi:hypothetical protein